MKKLLIIAMLALVSCDTINTSDEIIQNGDVKFHTTKVGDCEYVLGRFGEDWLFSHKGDCNNPIHKK